MSDSPNTKLQDFVDNNGGNSDLMRTRADLVAAATSICHSKIVTPDYFESFSLKQLRVRGVSLGKQQGMRCGPWW